MRYFCLQVVYILDQVRALENEMLIRIKKQGLDLTPRILIVSVQCLTTVLKLLPGCSVVERFCPLKSNLVSFLL